MIHASLSLFACATYTPPSSPPDQYRQRAVTDVFPDLSISAVVLSDQEAVETFGKRLPKKDIQAIWLEFDNRLDEELVVDFLSIDANYFSPAEAAALTRKFREKRSSERTRYYVEQHVPLFVPPMSRVSGYLFANYDPGAKAFTVRLLGADKSFDADFAMTVPGFDADFLQSQPNTIYTDDEIVDLDLQGLRAYLESLPCCALGGDGETAGDPLNVVLIGSSTQVLSTLVRRGWDLTESLRPGTAWRTAMSSVFGSRYRTSPVSPLLLFGRPQDAAFQKVRRSVDERNHMRLWRAPVNFLGRPVWIGQISRDIGVKLSGKTFVTHRIDPMVDEARIYLMLDIVESGSVSAFGFVSGVGESAGDEPRRNYTKDPYYTDGLRGVILLSDEPVAFEDVQRFDWEALPREPALPGQGEDH